ncbi:MAG: hypothetical protein K1060chlam4_01396, partial [Candidatus Anoxychlamydiales bacterium]|nr:hypothetical protein [Candidatus Anoxychlamydiales bacterium]
MDLTIKDVSELLNEPEATIKRWFQDGKIPGYKLDNQIRFSRSEIESWVMRSKTQKEKPLDVLDSKNIINLKSEKAKKIVAKKIGTQAFSLFRALYKGTVINNIHGTTKEDVIKSAVKIFAKNLSLDANVLTDLLLDREKLMPTSLN